MNKIIVVEDKNINSGEYNIKLKKNVTLNFDGNVIIHDINNWNNELNIIVNSNSSLDLYQVKNLKDDYIVNITLLNNSKFKLNMLIMNENCHRVNLNVNMVENEASANINVRAINKCINSSLDLVCKGYIKKDTKDNELMENLKGFINDNNECIKISPLMLIDTNEVSANHFVTIGTFGSEELFYLKSLGLSEDMAKKKLRESFLKQNMSTTELEFLNLGGENIE